MSDMEKQGGIYARYSPGRDRDLTPRNSPTLPPSKLHYALDTPEMQKAAVSGLIDENHRPSNSGFRNSM